MTEKAASTGVPPQGGRVDRLRRIAIDQQLERESLAALGTDAANRLSDLIVRVTAIELRTEESGGDPERPSAEELLGLWTSLRIELAAHWGLCRRHAARFYGA